MGCENSQTRFGVGFFAIKKELQKAPNNYFPRSVSNKQMSVEQIKILKISSMFKALSFQFGKRKGVYGN